jgi:ketosteroid isomerase-like protein
MAAGDIESVRRGIEAYNRGDVEAMIAETDPEVTMVPVRALLEGGKYHGHDGLRKFVSDMDEDWSEREILVDEIRDVDGRMLVLGTFRAVGRASGSEVRQPVAWVSDLRDQKLWRMQAFSDQDAARAEVGLSEGGSGATDA